MALVIIPDRDVYQLVDGVLDQGLSYVAAHLEKTISLPVVITDGSGRIHYPEISGGKSAIDDDYMQLPVSITDKEYHYSPKDKTLYYHVECSGSRAYVIVTKLSSNNLTNTVKFLREAKLAIKCYFSKTAGNRFEKALVEYLINGETNITDVMKLSDKALSVDNSYFVSIVQIDDIEAVNDVRLRLIRPHLNDYLSRYDFEPITILRDNYLIVIVPGFIQGSPGINPDCCLTADYIRFKHALEEKFKCKISFNLGQIHPLSDLHKSFKEALITRTFSKLTGTENSVNRFSDLGIFYLIFSQDTEDIKKYCLQTLGRLIEYDEKNNSELLVTLRKLFDTNFNIKHTAQNLYMHVNTLYYRIGRIEHLLNADLSKTKTRVDLFAALKVWDTLRIIDR